jgi:hypothetical protein
LFKKKSSEFLAIAEQYAKAELIKQVPIIRASHCSFLSAEQIFFRVKFCGLQSGNLT